MADESHGGGPSGRETDLTGHLPGDPDEQDHDDAGFRWSTRTELRSFAELLGVTSVAIAQPVLSVFSNDASAFVAVRANSFNIIAFALIVVLAPPIGLWMVERLAGFVGEAPRRWIHRGFIAALVALFVSRLFPAPLGPPAFIVVILAALGTVLVLRTEPARQFLRYLAFSPLLFMALFLLFSPVSSLVFVSQPPVVGQFRDTNLPPIVMVVFDELPLVSLLDGDGRIDAGAYPALAALAQDSTFARNNTTLSATTPVAVPTILTGVLPEDSGTLPTATAHPRSLFTLLGDTYRIRVAEHITHLCPERICEVPEESDSAGLTPAYKLLRQVPDVFTMSKVFFNIGFEDVDPSPGFEWLGESTGDHENTPTLRYLHSLVPHQPWKHLPDGRTYPAPNPPLRGTDADNDRAPAQLARQRHLMQTAYSDKLFGELIEQLKDAGVYDDSLIVVTADHGVSFRPGDLLRPLSKSNFPDIAWTPLLVKTPNQSEPRIIDSPTASIDILPTIIDVLGIDVDWDLDGQSLFDRPRPKDWSPHILGWEYDEVAPAADGYIHLDGPAGFAEILKTSSLDYGPSWDLRFWRWGEYGSLVGRHAASFEKKSSKGLSVTVDNSERFKRVDISAGSVPAYVSGHITGKVTEPVAVAVNGVIGAWYDTSMVSRSSGTTPFQAMVPPSLFKEGDNEIEVFLLRGDSKDPVLVETGSSR